MKLLLVGDLRDMNNYGAVITGSALFDSLTKDCSDHTIRSILGSQWFAKNDVEVPLYAEEFDSRTKIALSGRILKTEVDAIKWADKIVINAEGAIVHSNDVPYRRHARYIIFLAYLAAQLGKPVAIINHIVDTNSVEMRQMIELTYKHCKFVTTRDQASIENLRSYGVSSPVEFVPDAAFLCTWKSDESLLADLHPGEYVVLGDSARIGMVELNASDYYTKMIEAIRKLGYRPVVVFGGATGNNVEETIRSVCYKTATQVLDRTNCNYHQLARVIGSAALFISGRWHASILAFVQGTPFITFGTDSHKTVELAKMSELSVPCFPLTLLETHVDKIVKHADKLLSKRTENSSKLQKIAKEFKRLSYRNIEIVRSL